MRFKGGIRRKIVFFISMAILSVVLIELLLGYLFAFSLLRNSIARDHEKIAHAMASNIGQKIEWEIDYLNGAIVCCKEYKKALKESNGRYQKMALPDILKSMADMDKKWIGADKDSPLVKGYLETDISRELKDKCGADEEMAEVFLSDRFGGLVAASGKTSDFYQANESWWQSAFAGGRGDIFVGDIEFDKSSNTLAMIFALPVKDDDGSVIGIVKAVLDIGRIFSFLEDFESGHVSLVDERGYTIFHKGIEPLSRKLLSDNDFRRVLQGDAHDMILDIHGVRTERVFNAFAEVRCPVFLKRGIIWRVFIGQAAKEVFWPLYRLMLQALGLAVFLMVLIPVFGYIFSGRISRPIEKLEEATKQIANGNLDHPIMIKTGDELEELANSFRAMSQGIKERERQLTSQKMYLQGIIASMTDALITIDPDITIRSVNKAAMDLLGYREDELVGRPLKKIFLQEEEELYGYFQKIIDEGAVHDIGLNLHTKHGDALPVNFSGAMMKQEGEVIGIVGVARDMRQIMAVISDLEKKERELEEHGKNLIRMQRAMLHMMGDLQEVSRVRAQFTDVVSHELRTPLAVIKEGVSVVLDRIVGEINEDQRKYLDMVKKNVDRLNRLIGGVLDFQKLESGKMEFKMEENDVNEIVEEIRQAMLPVAGKTNLSFTCQLGEFLPRVRIDRDKIIQVLTNLAHNAVKFTEKGGITIITGRGDDNFIQVTVKDTGPGIKEEDMPKLFQQFTQLQRRTGGTGLGLSICKQIIEAHKGKIWAESEVGRGTAFHFTLPIKERRA